MSIIKKNIIVYLICMTANLIIASTPSTLAIQVNLTIGGYTNYSGRITIEVGIYQALSNNNPLWFEEYPVDVTNGSTTIILGKTKPLNTEIFMDDSLRIGFTPIINGQRNETEFIPLKSVPYAIHSEIASKANRLFNEQLFKIDELNHRIGINNLTPNYTLDVVGTINATAFIGDGSRLTNIQVSDDRLAWYRSIPSSNIYYTSGNVGIGTQFPSAKLDINGSAIISGNLTVIGKIIAETLRGDGSNITNLNASNITNGVISSMLISGNYNNITGLGTILSGTWNGTEISDNYISNLLTLEESTLQGNNYISGNILLTGDTTISGNYGLSLKSPDWSISKDGIMSLDSIAINNLLITQNIIEINSLNGLQIKPATGLGLFISATGSVGINTISPKSNLDVNGGIRIGDTTTTGNGIIRFNNDRFQGYKNNQWINLDNESSFDPHALHTENNEIKDLIFVRSDGNIGIGGIPSQNIHDNLVISGNVVFKNSIFSEDNLIISGSGSRLVWFPYRSAFRAGYVDNNQWDKNNIGTNSIVFGNSGLANENNTVIVGGKHNIVKSEGSVIVGGYRNEIQENSNYSTIVGGGSSTGQGNIISGGSYSTIIGGQNNIINNDYSTIIGGKNNIITGNNSVALGQNISINHNNTIIFSDGLTHRESSGDNQFLIYANGGVGIGIEPSPNVALNVSGVIIATEFIGDGSKLTGISATMIGGATPTTNASPNSIYISDGNGFLPDNTIRGESIVDGSITSVDIRDNSIGGDKIQPNSIQSMHIQSGAITSRNIKNGAITGDKIQANAITSQNIRDGSISSKNIAPNSISTHHIINFSVTNEKIATDTITSDRIVDETITSMDLAIGAIGSFNIVENAIQSHHIAKNTISSDNIAANAIQNQHINDLAVSSRNLANESIYTHHILDYSILINHISNNAIQSYHIDDAVISNDRIVDNSITSSKISPNAILSIHLPDDVIQSRHITDNAILTRHIGTGQIPGDKLSDGAIISSNIANGAITALKITDNAVQTHHILDRTITSQDIALNSIPNELIATNSITSHNIAIQGIASINIALNSITSFNIKDFSIVSADIADHTIHTNMIGNGQITAELIASNAIQSHHITPNSITSINVADNSLPYSKLFGPIPTNNIATNSISGDKLKDNSIDGSKIADGSITADKLADESISANNLIGIVPISKGGTGTNSFAGTEGALIFGKHNGIEVVFDGDPTQLYWSTSNLRLGIGTNTPEETLHVVGSIFADGNIYFGSLSNSISFSSDTWMASNGYIIIGPDSTPITSTTEPQGGLKTNDLYVKNKLGIGVQNPNNAFEIDGNAAIGNSYVQKSAPLNGLIIEGQVGIGTDTPMHHLDVNGSIRAKGIKGTGMLNGIGIEGTGGSIGIKSNSAQTGISVEAQTIGILATTTDTNPNRVGAKIVVENANAGSTGVLGTLTSGAGVVVSGALGKLTSNYAASIYGSTPISGVTNWAAYFDGPIKVSGNLGIGLSSGDTVDAEIHVKGDALIENTISEKEYSNTTNTIDWNKGNKQMYTVGSSTINFQSPSISGSMILTLRLILSATSTSLSFSSNSGSILWEKGINPNTTPLVAGNYIFSFYFDGIDYYGLQPLGFQ